MVTTLLASRSACFCSAASALAAFFWASLAARFWASTDREAVAASRASGDQMRSYVLQPYQMVKDLRTEHEVGNPDKVFDGDIDDFIEAGIRWKRTAARDA